MPTGLEGRYGADDLHFVTCSCYQRRPVLADDRVKQLFLEILEEVRWEYGFCVIGYVLMPEHFHLLVSEPEKGNPSVVLQVLQGAPHIRGSLRMCGRYAPLYFWQLSLSTTRSIALR